jgi:hypothetical protein
MRPLIVLAMATVACTASERGRSPRIALPPEGRVVLPGAVASGLLNPCTRVAPKPVEGYWLPDDSAIARLETDLRELLTNVLPRVRSPEPVPNPAVYFRQYAGILREGKRLIYVNAFAPPNAVGPSPLGADFWKAEAFLMCDGGPSYFGVEYDPREGRFARIEFNDSSNGPVTY